MKTVLHIDVAKVTGDYASFLSAKDLLSKDGVESPEVPLRIEEVEYGTYPKIKVDYIPIFSQDIETVFGPDWKEMDFLVYSCPAGSVTCGDLDDPNSEVSKIKAEGDFETLPSNYGPSAPDVYYSNLPKRFICGEVIFARDQGVGAAGVEVALQSENGAMSTTTDAFGDFEFKGLDDSSSYTATISAPGFVTQSFSIEPGAHADLGLIVLEAE